MNTDIEFLQQLETDLKDAAAREAAAPKGPAAPARRRTGKMWVRVAGVAAAFVVVAGAIGFVAGGGAFPTSMSGADGAGSLADRGLAPSGEVPEDARREVGRATDYFDDEGGAAGPQAAPAMPSPAPATDEEAAFDRFVAGRQQQDLSKIVRDGRIGIVVTDGKFGDAVGDLTFIAEQHGGFVLSSSTTNDRSGTFVLRIPAERFDRALADVRQLGTRVRFQEVRGDDVTAEVIDSQARLRILQTRRALLFDLFQQADTTDEILRMSGQMEEVQLRIEQMQGRLRFINNQVSESTLRVAIQEQNAPKSITETDVDNPDLGSSFDLAVQGFLRIVGAVIVGLGYLIPLTVLGAIVWMGVWLLRRRRSTT